MNNKEKSRLINLVTNLLKSQLEINIPEKVHIELKESHILFKGNTQEALILSTIYIDPSLRNQGLCTKIFSLVEQRALREKKRFIAGPILEDEQGNAFVGDMCKKRGFMPFPPFMYLKNESERENE